MAPDEVQRLLSDGRLNELIGLPETGTLEAKGLASYDLSKAQGRYELGKDVSSFCNASEGHIIIGAVTDRDAERATDHIARLELHIKDDARLSALRGVIASVIHPDVIGLQVQWWHSHTDSNLGLTVIELPRQADDRKPFLLFQVIVDEDTLRQSVVGYCERRGANSIPIDAKRLQKTLRQGMDGVSQRLSRIEDQLSRLEALMPDSSGTKVDVAGVHEQMTSAIDRMFKR